MQWITSIFQKRLNLSYSISEKCWKFIASKMLEIKSQHLTWVGPLCVNVLQMFFALTERGDGQVLCSSIEWNFQKLCLTTYFIWGHNGHLGNLPIYKCEENWAKGWFFLKLLFSCNISSAQVIQKGTVGYIRKNAI